MPTRIPHWINNTQRDRADARLSPVYDPALGTCRRGTTTGTGRRHMADGPRHMKAMTRDEAMRRLAGVQIGRIFFTSHAMPAVRPVNHLIDDGQVIIRSHEGSAIVTAANADRGVVVAYEADQLDPATRTGWSVVVTGLAHLVTDPQEADRYRGAVQSWVARQMD